MEIPTVPRMHSGLLQILNERLALEPMVLAARVGMGAEKIASTVAAGGAGIVVDAVVVGNETSDLALAITQTIVSEDFAAIAPEMLGLVDEPPIEAVGLLAETYGRRVGDAIGLVANRLPANGTNWTIADALGSGIHKRALVINHAERLSPRVLWELRDLAAAGLKLLLVTTPEHRKNLCGPEAAFFGYGGYVEMPVLGLPVWTTKLAPTFDPLAITELFREATGRTAVMLDVLANHRPQDRDLSSAWFRTVDERDHEAHTVMSLAPRINELAPFVLMAVAHGEPPYGREDRPDRIARVLRHLRDLDLTEQQEPRRWKIADPVLAAALRRLRPGYVELFPRI